MIIIETKLQCFVCKQTILTDSKKQNEMDPCAVTVFTNADKDIKEQKSQTFFCHYECFRKINNDDSVLYLNSLSTQRELKEENQTIHNSIEEFTQLLYEKADEYGIWLKLMKNNAGEWIKLKDIVNQDSELAKDLDKIENLICEPLLISWLDDYSSKDRSQHYLWKVVIIATESHYEFPVTLLIKLDKDDVR
ncbi:MAG: hypothetical protein N4A68_11920 [Maledivibacter sp.]|jgi:hypothetical protein|nr:hypothetical protein [Maledivibacter sp.]